MLGRLSFAAVCMLLGPGPIRAQAEVVPDRLLEGRVVDLLGDAIPAANVRLRILGQERGRTATDAQGFYRVRVRGGDAGELEFSAPGKVGQVVVLAQQEAATRRICLEDGARLSGRVTDAAGRPANGAVVVVYASNFSAQCVCDAQGNFELPAVPLRLCQVRVWAAEGVLDRAVRVLGDTRCELTLPEQSRAARRVQVVGMPKGVQGAHVQLLAYDQALQKDDGHIALGPDGSASFVATDTSLVQVVVPGFVVKPRGFLIDRGPGSMLEFRVSPEPAGSENPVAFVRGSLRDDADQPVAGQQLVVEDLSQVRLGSCVVGHDGAFAVPVQGSVDRPLRIGLRCGEWRVQSEVGNLARGHTWTRVWNSGAGKLDVLVERACGLRAELRGANGESLPFAHVAIAPTLELRRPVLLMAADRLGRIEVAGLPVDDYLVVVTGDDGSVAVGTFEGRPGVKGSPVRWQRSAGGTLEGRLTDPQGRGVPGVDLCLASPGMRDGGDASQGALVAKVTTDRLGRFRWRGCTAGQWTIVATKDHRIGEAVGEVVAGRTTFVPLSYAEALPAAEVAEGLAAPPPNGR